MKSLNTSLPRSPRRKRSNPPPEQLIQAFKAAALSVTNLYKTATADQVRARDAGYQDALDDILAFLDKENLGLGDGEGWRVRRWATERLDGSPLSHVSNDSDEDHGGPVRRIRSTSPVIQQTRANETQSPRQISRSASPSRAVSNPMGSPTPTERPSARAQPPETFSFRSDQPYPQDTDMQIPDNSSNHSLSSDSSVQGSTPSAAPAVRVELLPRVSRASHRASRHSTRGGVGARALGTGAGSKRAFQFGDYEFDLGGSGEGKDSSGGGGKRGRFI